MAAQNSQGIQTLLDAEKEAQKIVAKAREYRTQRVKEARGDAAKEIEAVKAKREEELKASEEKTSTASSQSQAEVDKKSAEDIEKIKQSFEKNRAGVIDMLMDRVVEVEPKLHRNYQKPKQKS